jgi:peptidoglycan/xylan/chitin deacetylase (PgdA/CDA1 family)
MVLERRTLAGRQVIGGFVGTCALMSLFACAVNDKRQVQSSVDDLSGPQLNGRRMPEKTLSLTFDDGPGERTAELSSFLRDEGISATFFVQGNNAERRPEVLEQLSADGHLVSNHSYSHPRMTKSVDPVDEVQRTDALIERFVDRGHFVFRAPYGDWSPRVASILNEAGLTKYVGSVFWDIGGQRIQSSDGSLSAAADWACWAYNDSIDRCLSGYLSEIRSFKKGIVLLHDIHGRTVDLTKKMVRQLRKEGYGFVRVDDVPSVAEALEKRTTLVSAQSL